MIILSNRYDSLDSHIADAAQGIISWSEALEEIAPLAGADGISMDLMFGDNRMVRSLGSVGFDQAMVDAYSDYYHRVDPRISIIQKFADHGVIFTEELRRPDGPEGCTEFWEWLDQSDAPGDASALVMPLVGDARLVLAVHRVTGRNDTPDITAFFQRFYDKLNAINTMLRRGVLPETCIAPQAYPLSNIDCFTFGVDDALQVRSSDLVTRYRLPLIGLGRLDEEGQLADVQPDLQAALGSVLQSALPSRETELTFKGALTDAMVRVSPAVDTEQGRRADVMVTFVKHTAEIEKVFMRAFGLTRRQAELLELLRKVEKLDEAAQMMAISRNTARVFLAQMFERTGVHSKTELLQLANRFA
ncbi:LuxR C-terminal-related transcriptional regulator [Blastomonas sp. AAP53]|uniref:helix-turn-helix transcriptional regulator n=1 Tax=Blastomonas sp. AAP53 TaxID=1248760 RepID=UPI00187C2110|nr:LuxR C-terminal-related transcriptional regulator [Blastomonas sp. AAP53]